MIKMEKIRDIQAVILAQEGYSHAKIAQKLNRSKWWVTKWVCRSRDNQLLEDKPRCGRPRILSRVAKKMIKKAKYKRGQSLRRLAEQLKVRGEVGGKDAIRSYMSNELKWKNWRRKKQPLLTENHKKRRIAFARQHKHWTVAEWSDILFTDESPFKVFYVPNARNDTVGGSQEENVLFGSFEDLAFCQNFA